MFGEDGDKDPEEYAREAFHDFKRANASRVREKLIMSYANGFHDRHGSWPGEEDIVRHIRDLHDHLDHDGSRRKVEAEKLLREGQESQSVCPGCLRLMDYKGWLETGMTDWDDGRPYMEAEDVKIYPGPPEGFDHVEEDKTVEFEYTCPTGEHDESYREFHFLSDEELDQVLESFADDAEKARDFLGLDD